MILFSFTHHRLLTVEEGVLRPALHLVRWGDLLEQAASVWPNGLTTGRLSCKSLPLHAFVGAKVSV